MTELQRAVKRMIDEIDHLEEDLTYLDSPGGQDSFFRTAEGLRGAYDRAVNKCKFRNENICKIATVDNLERLGSTIIANGCDRLCKTKNCPKELVESMEEDRPTTEKNKVNKKCKVCGYWYMYGENDKGLCNVCRRIEPITEKVDGKEFEVVTLCGSTKFKKEYEYLQKELTLEGKIVISVGCYGHQDKDERIWANKEMLDRMHKAKIDMADRVVVVCPRGYIGDSTKSEIAYAESKGIPVTKEMFPYPESLSRVEERDKCRGDVKITECIECGNQYCKEIQIKKVSQEEQDLQSASQRGDKEPKCIYCSFFDPGEHSNYYDPPSNPDCLEMVEIEGQDFPYQDGCDIFEEKDLQGDT